MLPIRTIVHQTDLSEQLSHASELAAALARDYDARLVLLHVAAPAEVVGEAGLVPVHAHNQEELRDKHLRSTEPHAEHGVEHRFARGDAATEILRVAQEERADLIMMTSQGWTALGQLGNVARQSVGLRHGSAIGSAGYPSRELALGCAHTKIAIGLSVRAASLRVHQIEGGAFGPQAST